MIDQTTLTTSRPDRLSSLQLPMQAAPIDRSQSATCALAADGGVEAAAWWDDIIKVATTVAPPLISALSDRTLKRDVTLVEWSH
jgi:hypothetical protein